MSLHYPNSITCLCFLEEVAQLNRTEVWWSEIKSCILLHHLITCDQRPCLAHYYHNLAVSFLLPEAACNRVKGHQCIHHSCDVLVVPEYLLVERSKLRVKLTAPAWLCSEGQWFAVAGMQTEAKQEDIFFSELVKKMQKAMITECVFRLGWVLFSTWLYVLPYLCLNNMFELCEFIILWFTVFLCP